MKRISVRNHNAAHVYYGLARRIHAMLFVLVMLVSSVGLPAIAEDDALQPNIYGMVQTRKLEEKQLTASLNGNSEITVTYGQAAQIPDGAQLVVTPVDDEAPYVQQAKKDLNVESVDFVQLFDMGIYYNGAKIEPANKVKISFRLTEDMKRDGDLRIIHFAKDPEPVPAAAPKKLMSVKGAKAAPMATQAQTDEDDLMSVQAAVIDTSITEELNLVFDEENMVSFETYGFSVFGICYTVDFEYTDPETGEIYAWSFPGTGSYLLSEVLGKLGITGEIGSASLALTEAVGETSETALYLTQDAETGVYSIHSDEAFDDTYTLTVVVDGGTYVITVTDAAQHIVTLNIANGVTIGNNVYVLIQQQKQDNKWYFKFEQITNSSTSVVFENDLLEAHQSNYQPYSTSTDAIQTIVRLVTADGTDEWRFANGTLNQATDCSTSYNNNPVTVTTVGDNTTITITKRIEHKHTANVQLEYGINTDNLYVLFIQTVNNVDYYSYKKINGNIFYESDADFSNGSTSVPYDPNNNTTRVLLWQIVGNQTPQTWMYNNLNSAQGNNYTFADGDTYIDSNSNNTYSVAITNSGQTSTLNVGNVGPVPHTAHIDFYEPWDSINNGTNLVSGYTLEATVGTDTYVATITGTGNLSFTKDGGTTYSETLPDTASEWKFKNNGTEMTGTISLSDYVVTNTNPAANSSHVYVFEARKPNTYTASLTFKDASGVVDQSPTLATNNYYLVVNDAIYAPVNATGLGTWVGVTDNKLPEITSFKFVQNTGTVSSVDDVKNLNAVSELGDYEILTTSVPAPDSTTHTYAFEAKLPQVCTAALTVTGGAPDTGYYYIVARKHDQNIGFIEITTTADPLTFSDGTNNITLDDNTSFWIVKSDSAITALSGFESVNDADKLTAPGTLGTYTFDWSLSGTVYGFTATKDIGDTLAITFLQADGSTTDSSPAVDGTYYLLVKGTDYQYKYYAPLTAAGFGTIHSASGEVPGMKDILANSFEIVKATGENPTFNELQGLTKIGNGGTIGEYYTVAIPSSANEHVYHFTATKQQSHSVSIHFQNASEVDVTPTLDAYYYLVAKVNGERKFFAPVTGTAGTLAFKDASGDHVSYLPDVTFELVKSENTANDLNSVPYFVVNEFMASDGTTEYGLGAATLSGTVYSFTPMERSGYQIAFRFLDENGEPVSTPTVPTGYYVLFCDNNNQSYAAAINANGTVGDVYNTTSELVSDVPEPKYFQIWDSNGRDSTNPANKWDAQQNEQVMNGGLLGNYLVTWPTMDPAPANGKYIFTAAEAPAYKANIQFVASNGTTSIADPGITGTYYYLVKTTINSQERFAVSDASVDFTGATSATFTTFYDQNGQNKVSSPYTGNAITQAWLVTTTQAGEKPTVQQAYNAQNGVTKYDVSNSPVFAENYTLSGAANTQNPELYTITATRMPAYEITSSFVDGLGAAVPKALSKGYYLVAKATISGNTAYYINTYDPAAEYEITHFYTSPNLTGSGEGKTAFVNGSAVEVYLVAKTNAADASAAIGATGANKITSGRVEVYTLSQTSLSGTDQTALTFTRGEAETYTTTIKFFTENAQIIEAAGDIGMHVDEANSTKKAPNLTKHYYVLATLTSKTDKSLAGWAINPVSPSGHEATSTLFTEFTPCDNTGEATEGTPIPFYSSDDFPYNITTRLFHTDAALTTPTYKNLVTDKTSNATDSAESGYEFVGNWNPDATHNEIHLKEASPKTYAVRVRFKTEDVSKLVAIGNDGYYVVHVIVTHADGNESVQYDRILISDFSNLPVDDEGYLYKEFQFEYWKKTDGGYVVKTDADSNPKFTGNEQYIKVELVKSSNNNGYEYNNYGVTGTSVYAEGTSAGAYVVHYDTRWTNPQNTLSRFHEEPVPGSDVVKCYDIIDLILPNADSEYDYSTILGPNYAFGIVADHLFHNNDLQTNFAVNHYTGHGDYVTPDLSNTSGMIVIGEFNRNTDIMAENHVGPAVDPTSEDGEDIKAGTVPLGNNIRGSLTIYADNDSGSRYATYSIAGGTPVSEVRNNVHVYMQNGENLQNQIVNPGIRYAVNMSRTLAAKEATYTPEMREGKPYVDTTGFPDAATIYIDADSMLKVSDETPGDVYGTLYELRELTINKKPDQMLIFNFKDPKTVNVKLNQFKVGAFATQTTTNSGTEINQTMEQLSKHIVWNFASCTRRVELSEIGGICLQPNYGSETQITGTSGGWLVSAGYVFNSSAEWHNFFQEVPENTKVTLRVMKTVDDKVPAYREADNVANPSVPENKEIFDFDLYEYKVGDSSSGWTEAPLATQQNIRSSVKFEIEDRTTDNEKKLTPGWHVYKIVEKQEKPAGNTTANNYIFDTNKYFAAVRVTASNGVMIAGAPMYFSSFDPAPFNQAAIESADIPAALTNPLMTVTFKNEVKKEGLTVHKIVEGTDSSKVPFTFKIEVWKVENETNVPLNNDATDYTVTGLAGTSKIRLTPNGTYSEGTLILRNGQSATITGLPENSHYKITETLVNGKTITYNNTTSPVDGYVSKTDTKTGTVVTGGVREEFVNEYHASGSTTLHVHKELKNTTTITLPDNAYGFELHQGSTKIGDTIYNDASGNAQFPALSFTEEDMEGAILNPFTGKRVKVLTYRVHEVNGTLTDFAYDQFINDADKLIVVTLTDNGDGTITAATFPYDATFRFNNDKGIEVTLEGSKIMIGRDMKSGETFRFVAKENVGGTETTVATATLMNARDGEETAFTFTPIKYAYTEAGTYTHTYTISEVTGTISDINYDTTTSYTATVTITVDGDGNATSAVSYSDIAPFINTSKNTTSASVEKVWTDGNQNHTSDSVKVRLYKVIGDAINPQPTIAAGEEPTAYVGYGTDEPTGTGGLAISLPSDLPQGAVAVSKTVITLSKANNWKYTWSKLPTMEKVDNVWKSVTYYPVETWSSNINVTNTAYDLETITHKTIIRNTVEEHQTGSLKITKNATVNGDPTLTTLADGTYSFTIRDSSNNYASGKVGGVAIVSGQVSITISGGVAQTVEVTDLTPGTYTITETTPTNGTTLTGASRADNDSSAVASNVVTVIVMAGKSGDQVAADGIASFVNNYETKIIKAKKNWPEGQTVPANTTVQLTLSATVPGEGENAEPVVHTISSSVTTVVTLNGTESPAWTHTWNDLPKYDTAGKLITYTVAETAYTIGGVSQAVATADSPATEGYQFSFTNTLPSTDIRIVKVEQGTTTQLNGAQFQLKKYNGTEYVEEGSVITVNGTHTFTGLADGQYKIVETQAPAGYNMMTESIFFTIIGGAVTWTDKAGSGIESQAMVTYTPAQTAAADNPDTPEDETAAASPATFTIGNTPGVELPSTGGPGTAAYLAAGIALMALALILAQIRRKRSLA